MSTPTPAPEPGDQPGASGSGVPTSPGQPAGYGQYGQQHGQYGQPPQPPGYGQPPQPPAYGQPPQPPAYGQPPQPPGYGQPPQPPGYGQQDGWGAAPEAPQYGAPGPQSYGQYGAPGPGPAFTVAQPGIIPLRPLTLGEIYDGAFKAIRANPAVMFGLAAAVVALVTIVQGVLTWGLYEDLNRLAGVTDPTAQDIDDLYGSLSATVVPNLVASAVTFVVTTILNGILIHSVSQSVIGRRLSLGELWSLVRPQLLKLLLMTIVIGLAAAAALVVFMVPGILGAATGDLGTAVLLLLLGIVLGLLALLFVIVVTVLATPVLVLERSSVLTALRRSWQLTRPTFWRIAGVYLLTSILVAVVTAVVSTPIGMLGNIVGGTAGMTVAQLVGSTAAAAITTPFMAAVIALLYIDIRIRTEGLDVELAAAAAADS